MTIETTTNTVEYSGNDVATSFDTTYKLLFSSSELQVTLVDTDGVETTLVEDTDYTVNITDYPNTGSITYPIAGDPLATGERLILQRVLDFKQEEIDLENQGGYFPEVQETGFDKITCLAQQLNEKIGRCLITSLSSTENTDAGEYLNTIISQTALATSAASSAQTAQTGAETAEDLAEEWASKTDGQVDTTDYSAKAHAIGGTGVDNVTGSSKAWATTAEDTEVITGEYSAKHWAKKAEASAESASPITTEGDIIVGNSSGNASRVAIGADKTLLKSNGTSLVYGKVALDEMETVLANANKVIGYNASGVPTAQQLPSGVPVGHISLLMSDTAEPSNFIINFSTFDKAIYPEFWQWVKIQPNLTTLTDADHYGYWQTDDVSSDTGDCRMPKATDFIRLIGDSGRTVGSYEADDNKSHNHGGNYPAESQSFNYVGTGTRSLVSGNGSYGPQTTYYRTVVASGGIEARPKNFAFNLQIRYEA